MVPRVAGSNPVFHPYFLIIMSWFNKSTFNWSKILTLNDLEDLIKMSFQDKILIFKHSTRCSISSMAKNRIESGNISAIENCYLLDLLSHREISNKIESIFSVKHESPQVLIIKEGKCIQHLSHLDINWLNIK